MTWRFTGDVEEHAAATGALLERDPARHTISLTAIADARRGHRGSEVPALYGRWADRRGVLTGAASHGPPSDLVVEAVPDEAVAPLADGLAELGRHFGGVFGPPAVAARFAATWARRARLRAVLHHAQRLHRVGPSVAPSPAPAGAPRVAAEGDADLVLRWVRAFDDEAGTATPDVADRLASQALALWVGPTGRPVSVAGRSRATAGMVRVGPVYTPPEHRARGYAAAATFHASRAALDAGAREVVLFTDLANPTSNALYRRLGYLPLEDRLALLFRAT